MRKKKKSNQMKHQNPSYEGVIKKRHKVEREKNLERKF
jgi:hypothetical protein